MGREYGSERCISIMIVRQYFTDLNQSRGSHQIKCFGIPAVQDNGVTRPQSVRSCGVCANECQGIERSREREFDNTSYIYSIL